MTDKYKPHQMAHAEKVITKLNQHKMCYLAGEPRSGKTRTALRVVERLGLKRVLVLCPKQAIPGWKKEIDATGVNVSTVVNYEQAKTLDNVQWDLVIVDEAHNLGAYPRMAQRTNQMKRHTMNSTYMLCMSATPCVESPSQLFHSFYWLRSAQHSFYHWHRRYGIPNQKFFGGRTIADYSQCRPEVLEGFGRLCVTMTQEDAGIFAKVQDVVHELEPSEITQIHLGELRRHGITHIGELLGSTKLVAESEMALRNLIHQIETGALYFEDEYIETGCKSVLEYVCSTWNKDTTAIMAHYRATQKLFKDAGWTVYSSQASAEGIDLSHYDDLVIINTGYSGAKHLQRRERLVNMTKQRDTTVVHHITVKDGLSPAVYAAVSSKQEFNLRAFKKWRSEKLNGS